MNDPIEFLSQPIDVLQAGIASLPQYQPTTRHYFHGGMYAREVYRDAGVCVIGKVHKKEHFYVIASGTVRIGRETIVGPAVLQCQPGTKRAVISLTPTTCITFHRTDATTVEEAEAELVEDDPTSMYALGNEVKQELLS